VLSKHSFLKIKRLKCEYRVSVGSRHTGEWHDLSYIRLLFELLIRLKVREAEFNTVSGYYNANEPSSNEKNLHWEVEGFVLFLV
jgi:hypothetical protein